MYDLVPHLAPHPLTQINITRFVKKEQLIFSFIKYKESIIIQKYNIDKKNISKNMNMIANEITRQNH